MGVRFSHPQPLPQPNKLRYFRGIAQLVARLVRDEEAVGSNPAAPTKKRHTFRCVSFFVVRAPEARGPGQGRGPPGPGGEKAGICRIFVGKSPLGRAFCTEIDRFFVQIVREMGWKSVNIEEIVNAMFKIGRASCRERV